MGRISQSLLKSLIRRPLSRPAENDDGFARYFEWQFRSSGRLFGQYPDFDVKGKEVLEIGCGTGGRAAYLASLGAKRVVGIDINAEEIDIARDLSGRLHPELSDTLTYSACGEDDRLDIGQFDVCVLVDCLEHVVSPPAMMRLAYSYLKDGGHCYASCYGYYHHRGSHTGLLPFVNVFFSDETILNVIRERVSDPQYSPSRFDSDPPIERWRGIYDLRDRPGEHLNKLTVRDMSKLVRHSIFRKSRMTVIGFGGGRRAMRAIDWLRHVPLVREMYHSYVVLDFQR